MLACWSQVEGLKGKMVVTVACGHAHTIALTAGGEVFGFGYNAYGQLGTEDTSLKSTPTQIVTGHKVSAVACGHDHTAMITEKGTVLTCGRNHHGQLGNGTKTNTNVLAPVQGALVGKTATAVACGYFHTVVSVREGKSFGFGYNRKGQLGIAGDGHLLPALLAVEGLVGAGSGNTQITVFSKSLAPPPSSKKKPPRAPPKPKKAKAIDAEAEDPILAAANAKKAAAEKEMADLQAQMAAMKAKLEAARSGGLSFSAKTAAAGAVEAVEAGAVTEGDNADDTYGDASDDAEEDLGSDDSEQSEDESLPDALTTADGYSKEDGFIEDDGNGTDALEDYVAAANALVAEHAMAVRVAARTTTSSVSTLAAHVAAANVVVAQRAMSERVATLAATVGGTISDSADAAPEPNSTTPPQNAVQEDVTAASQVNHDIETFKQIYEEHASVPSYGAATIIGTSSPVIIASATQQDIRAGKSKKWSQTYVTTNKDEYEFTAAYPAPAGKDEIVSFSPSGKRKAVFRLKNGDTEGCVEIWSADGFEKGISTHTHHGKVYVKHNVA